MVAINKQQRHLGSNRRGSKSHHHGIRWLSTSIYFILGLMVFHLMVSKGDPPEARPSVNGKTRSSSDKKYVGSSDGAKRVPSYKQPEHASRVADIVSENKFFDRLPDESQQFLIPKIEASADAKALEIANSINQWNEGGGEEAEDGATPPDSNTLNGGGEQSESQSEDEDGGAAFEDSSEDVGDNVLALQAQVHTVYKNLRDAAQKQMEAKMDVVDAELEGYMSKISSLCKGINKKYFPNKEWTEKVEELVFDRLRKNTVEALQDQVDLFIVSVSDDVDQLVLDLEDEGRDVIEIDEELQDFEADTLPELEDEVNRIFMGIRNSLTFTVTDMTQSTLELLFTKLQHEVTLEFDYYEQFRPEEPLDVSFDEEQVLSAIYAVRADDDSDSDEDITGPEDYKPSESGDVEGEEEGDPLAVDGVDEEKDEDDSAEDGIETVTANATTAAGQGLYENEGEEIGESQGALPVASYGMTQQQQPQGAWGNEVAEPVDAEAGEGETVNQTQYNGALQGAPADGELTDAAQEDSGSSDNVNNPFGNGEQIGAFENAGQAATANENESGREGGEGAAAGVMNTGGEGALFGSSGQVATANENESGWEGGEGAAVGGMNTGGEGALFDNAGQAATANESESGWGVGEGAAAGGMNTGEGASAENIGQVATADENESDSEEGEAAGEGAPAENAGQVVTADENESDSEEEAAVGGMAADGKGIAKNESDSEEGAAAGGLNTEGEGATAENAGHVVAVDENEPDWEREAVGGMNREGGGPSAETAGQVATADENESDSEEGEAIGGTDTEGAASEGTVAVGAEVASEATGEEAKLLGMANDSVDDSDEER